MMAERDELLPTRWSLLSRLKNWDDQASWQEFFDTYWKLIYGVAIKAGLTDAEAQDVVQETVITVAKNLEQFKMDPSRGARRVQGRADSPDPLAHRRPVSQADARSRGWWETV